MMRVWGKVKLEEIKYEKVLREAEKMMHAIRKVQVGGGNPDSQDTS